MRAGETPATGPEYTGLGHTAVPCVHWHRDTFSMPDGAVHLAGSRIYSHQAFRWGPLAYGLQFHIEVDRTLAERWRPHLPAGVTLDGPPPGPGGGGRSPDAASVRRAIAAAGQQRRRLPPGDLGPALMRAADHVPTAGPGIPDGAGTGQTGAAWRLPRSCLLRLAGVGHGADLGRTDPGLEGHHVRLRHLHLHAVRCQCPLPPAHLGTDGPSTHAACGPLDHLHRHRRLVHRCGRDRPQRSARGPRGAVHRLGRRTRRHHVSPGLARRSQMGDRPALRGGGLGRGRGTPAVVPRAGRSRVHAPARGRAGLFGGAVVYALKRPDPVAGVFGYHEVFHACTIVGAVLHFVVIAFFVLPLAG